MEFQRLKDKLGTRSLPSSEVEFRGAQARLVGEEGRGVPAIIRMVNHTRLDCLLGASTGLRRGTLEAIHHARHRSAFGKLLAEQPAMRNVLADLAVESEAATAAAIRVARAYDADETAFRRFATAVMKYWVCKRAPGHAAEALECLGGNGFVEDSGMPLLYRDAPLNSIWEGSGNVAALDVLRAMVKEPGGLPAFLEECELAAGADARLDAHIEGVRRKAEEVFQGDDPQFEARRMVEELALALQASLPVRHASPAIADAFCGGYDLVESAEGSGVLGEGGPPGPDPRSLPPEGSPLDPRVIAANHNPSGTWDPMVDHAMMSRNVRAFMSLFHCSKPVVCKVHGFCVAGGTDMALCSDLLVIAADAKIGYPPARVWGSPPTSMWAYRLGPQRARRRRLTGDW